MPQPSVFQIFLVYDSLGALAFLECLEYHESCCFLAGMEIRFPILFEASKHIPLLPESLWLHKTLKRCVQDRV